ncbi:MAG: 50S ribosomal protein L24 [Anaerolineae bacterium]|nr:50S ribosomal protein L24 [Anaerolineae bacterium]MDQ7036438.1 50S ribosomal protein L24 [Anaerolineae bacterium]
MQRIKKGDTVKVIAGKDKGFDGEVIRVFPKANRLIINNINIMKKHEKARQVGNQQIPAQISEFEAPMDLSNVMLVCPKCEEATRVGFDIKEDGYKTRVCKKCNEDID